MIRSIVTSSGFGASPLLLWPIIAALGWLTLIASAPGLQGLRDAVLARAAPVLTALMPRTTLSDRDRIAGIVVLGGGPGRIYEAASLAKRFPGARVVLSGPGEEEAAFAASEPSLRGRLVIEPRARNTFENAVYSRDLIKPGAGQRWLLVTSAVHMPRAYSAFCAAGFRTEPWPVDDLPAAASAAAGQVQHEILGLIAYRLMGRIRAFVARPGQTCA